MRILRDPRLVSGYVYEQPVDDLPELTHCGEALCGAGHHMAPHAHTGFEFMYLSRGEARWQADGKTVVQGPGDLYVAYPREQHGTGSRRNAENQQLWVGLELDGFGPDGRRLARRLKRERPVLLNGCESLEPVLRGIVDQVVNRRLRRTAAIRQWLNTLMVLLEQRLDAAAQEPGARTDSVLPHSHGVQQALAFLASNLDRRVSLRDLTAVAMARSAPHFCARFRREVGVTPAAHHLLRRLEAARAALLQPTYDITTTAMQFGFSSSQHFSTQFRRAFGESPRAWQRRKRSGG